MTLPPVEFRTYCIADYNPFRKFPADKFILATADEAGLYEIHIRFPNGLGLSSVNKYDFYESAAHAFAYADELGYPDSAVWIDLPDHVIEQSDILSRKLKKELQQMGYYWKK